MRNFWFFFVLATIELAICGVDVYYVLHGNATAWIPLVTTGFFACVFYYWAHKAWRRAHT